MTIGRRARHRGTDCGRLQRRAVIAQDGFHGLAEVLHAMEPIPHRHGLRRPPAQAGGREVTPIATDHSSGGMLGPPRRAGRGRALRQEVHDAIRHEIDQDGTMAMAPPPGPFIDADGLQGWRRGHRGGPHQPEQGRGTGRQLQTGGPSGAGVPASRPADGPEGCGQSLGVTAIRRDEVRHARGEDPAPAGPITAAECPPGQRDPDGPRSPGQGPQVALVAAMCGGRGHGTAWAGGGRGCRGELERYRRLCNSSLQEADPTGGWA
jgi:hypothetical protein